jgi:AsmA protein
MFALVIDAAVIAIWLGLPNAHTHLSGWQENAAEKTDFATLGASFKIAKGQAQTADLRLAGPLVRMTGSGNVDLPGKALKFRVDPQLVASLEGQGGKSDLQGLGVPIMIAGPWARPSIYPDIEGILQDPAAAYEQLNRLGGGPRISAGYRQHR